MAYPKNKEEMIARGMIPLSGNDDEYSVGVREKLKGSTSLKRSNSAKIRAIKTGQTKHKVSEHIMDLIRDPELNAMNIIRLTEEICQIPSLKPAEKIQLLRAMNDTHRTLFGNKLDVKSDVKITTSADAVIERLQKWKLEEIKNEGDGK